MSVIRIPPRADPDLQAALRDIEAKFKELESRLTDGGGASVASRIVAPGRSEFPDDWDVMVGSGPAHSIGHVPDPGVMAYDERVLHEDGVWRRVLRGIVQTVTRSAVDPAGVQRSQDVVNVLGALMVTGPVEAAIVRARVLSIPFVAVRAHKSSNLTVNTGAATVVPLDVDDFDPQGFHDPVTNNSRLVVPQGLAGWYVAQGLGRFAATATATWRQLVVTINTAGTQNAGNTVASVLTHTSNNQVVDAMVQTDPIYLVAGDYLELFGVTGENTTLSYVDRYYDVPSFGMYRVGT